MKSIKKISSIIPMIFAVLLLVIVPLKPSPVPVTEPDPPEVVSPLDDNEPEIAVND